MKITGKEAYRLMLKDYPDIMSIDEMCAALKVSNKTGYKLLKEGKINSICQCGPAQPFRDAFFPKWN